MSERSPKIKLYISCHKNVGCVKNDVFQPIFVGSALKKNKTPKGFLRDDEGDNISEKNPRFCELTAQYWAWKNDTNSDYIGLMHYRRYLDFAESNTPTGLYETIPEKFLSNLNKKKYGLNAESVMRAVQGYDIVLPKQMDVTMIPEKAATNYDLYAKSIKLHEDDLKLMLQVLKEKYPDYLPYAEAFLSGTKTHLCNISIMKREIFNEYNKWLFDILDECDKRIDYTHYSIEAIRTPGHLAERLLNIFVAYQKDHKKLKIKELTTLFFENTDPEPEIAPAFENENIPIVLSANDYYSPYLATVLTSLRETSSKDHSYDIVIMNKDISDNNKNRMARIFRGYNNFSLRFVNMCYYEEYFADLFLRGHFTVETWFRLLLPKIMSRYEKVVYLDADLIVMQDISDLYKVELGSKLLAACHDADTAGLYNGFNEDKKNYMDNMLKIRNPYNYFQAGVLVLNLAEFRKQFKAEEILKYASSYDFQLLDQDVLNNLAQDKVEYVDMAWNVMFDWNFMRRREIISLAPKNLIDEYDKAHADPKIVHYAGPDKPWLNPAADYADLFWNNARKSGYYEDLLIRLQRHVMECENRPKNSMKAKGKNTLKKVFPATSKRGKIIRKIAKIRK